MPVLVILGVAGVVGVIDQLINNGDVAGTILKAFFTALQALADAVFAGVGAIVDVLPDAADLDLHVPAGVIG